MGNSCAYNLNSAIIGTLFAPVLGPFGYAIGGVAPGQNYTGNGNCSQHHGPQREFAFVLLFFGDAIQNAYSGTENKNSSSDVFFKLVAIHQYIQMQKSKGEPTILDGLNTNRKQYTIFLIGLVMVTNTISPLNALAAYIYMTDGVQEPKHGVDRSSYNHDYSDGSNPARPRAKAANNRWVRNAWANANNPYDYALAATGTVLFKTANLVGDLSGIKKAKRTSHSSCKHCSINFQGSY